MRTMVRTKILFLLMAFGLMVATAGVAVADRLDADADTLATATPAANSKDVNQQPGTTQTYDFSAAIANTGANTAADNVFWSAGDTVTVNNTFAGDWVNASSSTSSFSFTAYNQNRAGTISVSVPCDATTAQAVTVTLDATASNGNTLNGDGQTVTYNVTPTGSPNPSCPTADAGGPYEGNENTNIALSGSGQDPESGPLTYAWDFDGDGQFDDSDEQNPTFAAPAVEADTVFTVKLRVTDAQGLTDTDTATVTVKNVVNTNPELTVPANITKEATSSAGAAVAFTGLSATDTEDGTLTPSCTIPGTSGPVPVSSGDTFPIGTTTVTCSVTDSGGLSDSDSFTVTVRDTTGPVLSLPANITGVEATGPNGAPVTFTATSNDAVDGSRTVNCTPSSGSTFDLGTTTVNCSASDSRNNTSNGSFTVTVVDTTGPVFTNVPADITAEATSASGATVTFTKPTATDAVDGVRTVTCDPASGSTFALGTTEVSCSASDTRGNSNSATFDVTVQDTTAPVISGMPSNISLTATSSAGAVATWTAPTASDLVDGSRPVTCKSASDLVSGSTFPLGTTTVTCTASDTRNNTAEQSFTVNVTVSATSFLQPINLDGDSIFKQGSTVPVKFQLTGDSAGITNLVANLRIAKVSNNIVGDEIEAITSTPASTGSLFRYDATSGQYIYNWGTKGYTAGTYQLRIDLGDGVTRTVLISLKK